MKSQEQDTWPGFVHPPHSSCTKHLTTTRAPGVGRFVLGLDLGHAQPRMALALLAVAVSLKYPMISRGLCCCCLSCVVPFPGHILHR